MTDTALTPSDLLWFDRGRLSQRHSTWTVAGAGVVTLGVLAAAWMVDHRSAAFLGPSMDPGTARLNAAFHTPPAKPLASLPIAPPPVGPGRIASKREGTLLDPGFVHGPAPLAFADNAPLEARFIPARPSPVEAAAPTPLAETAMTIRPADAAHDAAPVPMPPPVPAPLPATATAETAAMPLPTPRPALVSSAPDQGRGPVRRMVRNTDTAPSPVSPAPADNRSFIEKFFGALKPSGGPTLAYASPETDSVFGRAAIPAGPASTRDPYSAIYDISNHTVYMPDGTKLEAHSGLGRLIDDPRHVDARNVGATPPHVYDLQLRESLFHGVQALRLNPVGGGGVYGRTGLLAHTFMLGPNGDSNGCVSFRDYATFLRAYRNGQIRRLVVVAGLG